MPAQPSRPSRALRSVEVIARFSVRIIILVAFAAFAGVGFAVGLTMLLWTSAVLCAGVAMFKRELPAADVLNHWDEAAACVALCCLVESASRTAA
jgi:hypothetical protein